MAASGSILGNAVLRREDPALLKGERKYSTDLEFDGMGYVQFVRSTVAHGRITSIDTSEATGMPGVAAVYTSENLDLPLFHGFPDLGEQWGRPPLAKGKVRFVGDIVAAVVADTPTQAADAAEAVFIDYEILPAVTDCEAAMADGAPILFEDHGTNVAFATNFPPEDDGVDPLEGADQVATMRMVSQRLAGVPMEPNGIIAVPDGDGMTAWISTQAPHAVGPAIAEMIGMDPAKLRARAPAVGGGFGPKAGVYVEFFIAAKAAMELGRPVKWTETRSENMVSLYHGRDMVLTASLGVKNDGTITGLKAECAADCGAYPAIGSILPMLTQMMSQGVYNIPKIKFSAMSAATNTTTTAAYRGAGRPEAAQMLERVVDVAANQLGMDPADFRRKNYLDPSAFPMTTLTGANYDSGEYEKTLDKLLDVSGYAGLRAEQQSRRDRGDNKLLGIGMSTYVEVTAPIGLHVEYGAVEVHDDGKVTMKAGTASHGQGHETAFSMLVSEQLGVPMEDVTLVQADTLEVPRGAGTMGSRSLQTAGNAIYEAAGEVMNKAKQLAAHLLEANAEDIVKGDGGLQVAGVPAQIISWADLAQASNDDSKRPAGMDPGLAHEGDYDEGDATYPFGSHLAVVEVDRDTGEVELIRHVAVDDCGTILNPLLVNGQQHGGIAQGAAQALYEGVSYDEDGNPVTGNLLDYAMPSAAELPSYEVHNTETASPRNALGAKGIGESGTIGSTPAIHNAVCDAVVHLGVGHIDMPTSAQRVWTALQTV